MTSVRCAGRKRPPAHGRVQITRQEIFDFIPDLGLKLGKTEPEISGTVPTNWHTTIPKNSVPISACFDDDPRLLNSKIAEPR